MMWLSYLRLSLDKRHCSIHTRRPPLCCTSLPYNCSCSGSLEILRSAWRKSSIYSTAHWTVIVPWIAHLSFEVSGRRSMMKGTHSSGMTWWITFQIFFETLRSTCEPGSCSIRGSCIPFEQPAGILFRDFAIPISTFKLNELKVAVNFFCRRFQRSSLCSRRCLLLRLWLNTRKCIQIA